MSDVTSSDSPHETPAPLGFGARLVLAFILPWKVFFNGALAARVSAAESNTPAALPPAPSTPPGLTESEAKTLKDRCATLETELEAAQAEAKKASDALETTTKKLSAVEEESEAQAKVLAKRNDPDGALHLLRIFQRDGRLIDFLREDIAGFGDADIGGAARLVHEGCRKSLDEYFVLDRVRSEEEGNALTVPAGFDAQTIRLTGNVAGDGPYKGTLAHAGWKANEVKLPSLPPEHDPKVIAPAEVEL